MRRTCARGCVCASCARRAVGARVSPLRTRRYADAWAFFAAHTARVEIMRERRLERFYFARPPVTSHMTLETKEALLCVGRHAI